MIKAEKLETAYKTISEATRELELIDKKNGNLQTHTLRYWESQFKQLKPIIRAGKRRYYSKKDMNIMRFIKFLLKDKGLTIVGAKKILNNNKKLYLDETNNWSINSDNFKTVRTIKAKVKKISRIVNELKDLK